MRLVGLSVVAAALVSMAGMARGESQVVTQKAMDFSRCVPYANTVISSINVPANRIIPIVNTSSLWMIKIVTDDANLVITCSKPDGTFLVVQSTPPDTHLIR